MTRAKAFSCLLNGATAEEWEQIEKVYGPTPIDRLMADLANLDELDRTLADPHHYGKTN